MDMDIQTSQTNHTCFNNFSRYFNINTPQSQPFRCCGIVFAWNTGKSLATNLKVSAAAFMALAMLSSSSLSSSLSFSSASSSSPSLSPTAASVFKIRVISSLISWFSNSVNVKNVRMFRTTLAAWWAFNESNKMTHGFNVEGSGENVFG